MKMTGTDFLRIRMKLKLTHMQLARVLGYAANASISRFENSARKPPPIVARLMFMLGKHGIPKEFEDK